MNRLVLLAWATGAPPGGAPGSERGEEFGKTSPIALVVIILLGVATFFLIRSMNKQLRKVPASFDHDDEQAGPPAGRSEQAEPPDAADVPGGETDPTGRSEGPPRTGSP